MITFISTIGDINAWLGRLGAGMGGAVEDGITAALDDLMGQLEQVTPVRSGAMQASYTIGSGFNYWELLDTAQSPTGYDYPGRVTFQPGFSRQYGALNAVLDSGERTIEAALDAALASLIQAP